MKRRFSIDANGELADRLRLADTALGIAVGVGAAWITGQLTAHDREATHASQ